ncbi:oligopeptide/dipeptide ABC transporter ATP-binding protein [Vineibacter terrae]|uniref:ABC transporter ATP-binding protein n=1 Tax=Vineibacter terrae TaxID=2586908 RepID=UPI002E3184C1|nr:oligopeptide/dipeptide ABC transporter ATP-binding protein [Vineibacter terrae]HEX2888918.1 oligopeptide/dipeptide ABC transporter ATP-binding protein [Vineibacter terrae]
MSGTEDLLLEVSALAMRYPVRRRSPFAERRYVHAVNGIDIRLRRGETLGIVGESGCGKTTLARCILRLLEPTGGRIVLDGRDITHARGRELRAARRDMQFVFQDPYAALDPRLRAVELVREPLDALSGLSRAEATGRAVALLEKVGLTRAQAQRYPHQFSGGQRQRIGIARALALNPKLVLADEPVSALDVSIRAQILNLMADLRQELGLSYIVISHDLAIIDYVCDRVAIIYLGRIVEQGAVADVFSRPRHPYTQALLAAIPHHDPRQRRRAAEITGDLPNPTAPPPGCAFHPRCPKATDLCKRQAPLPVATGGHEVACHHAD